MRPRQFVDRSSEDFCSGEGGIKLETDLSWNRIRNLHAQRFGELVD
jgi:hypothetical protein